MELPRRKKNRLSDFDYSSAGAYFVTICTEQRVSLLCDETTGDEQPVPNHWGSISEKYILQIPERFPAVAVEKYVVMPNHIHILLMIEHSEQTKSAPNLGTVIGWYKYNTTKHIRSEFDIPAGRIFQRSYHDHVVRNERDFWKIWEYIDNNPAKWTEDCFYSGT